MPHTLAPHPARLNTGFLAAARVAIAIDTIVDELGRLMILAKENPEIFSFNPWDLWLQYALIARGEDGNRRWILVATAKDVTTIFHRIINLVESVEGLVRAQLHVDRIPQMDIRLQGLLAMMDNSLGIIQGSGGLKSLEMEVEAKLAREMEVEALFED